MFSSHKLSSTSEGIIFNGRVIKKIFKVYIEDVFLSALKPGDIVFMDKLRAYNVTFNWRKFKPRKVVMKHLHPYSPDLNPIEMMLSVEKNKLRCVSPQEDVVMWREVSLAHLEDTSYMMILRTQNRVYSYWTSLSLRSI